MELAEPLSVSQLATSKHLEVPERRPDIPRTLCTAPAYRLEAKALVDAIGWLEDYRRFWGSNYQRFAA
jgi:hypothetical protein